MEQVLIVLVAFISNLFFPQSPIEDATTQSNQIEDQAYYKEVDYNNREYRYALFTVLPSEKLEIKSNLSQQLTSEEIIQQENCKKLINGGFYSEENTHIGWLVSDSVVISPNQTNDLMNGYVNVTNSLVTIDDRPKTESQYGIQTGPVLIENGINQVLELKNDKARRRSFAFTTTDNTVYFGIILEENSNISGPFLVDLPHIVDKLIRQESLHVDDAINLDGGTASAYHDAHLSVLEINPIGSYFCIK